MTTVTISEIAEADLVAIISYTKIEWGNSQAKVVKMQLQSAILFLSSFPECGHPTKQPGAFSRIVPKLPFVILYKYTKNKVTILQILHTKRNR